MDQTTPDNIASVGELVRTVEAWAHPSLAIAKYWGKLPGGTNIPATPSVAVTLGAMTSRTTVRLYRVAPGASRQDHDGPNHSRQDQVLLNGLVQDPQRFRPFFDALRQEAAFPAGAPEAGEGPTAGAPEHYRDSQLRSAPTGGRGSYYFQVQSNNDFPTAAGLASSAAGFAALAAACLEAISENDERAPGTAAATGLHTGPLRERASRLARIGSGSACRSVYGGFTRWDAGSEQAVPIQDEEWWPDLRVVILPVTAAAKPVSSREAMNRTRDSSPFYGSWQDDAPAIAAEVEAAIAARDLERLGDAARLSYLRMFGTMLAANPPIVYWLPNSVSIIRELEILRSRGIPAWETMDAGPQVKVITDGNHAKQIAQSFQDLVAAPPIVSTVGPGVQVVRR